MDFDHTTNHLIIYCIRHVITFGSVGNMRDLRFNCVLLRVGKLDEFFSF
jgi:hypothetical protein